jgi:DNA-binding transcriptional LysR family regulator
MRFSLRQLEVFSAIAQHQNVSQAALGLHMSQSAASGALNQLETQYSVSLFDRVGKRLKLNEQGRQFRARAEALLEQARALERDLSQHAELGNLTIGATLTIGNYLCVDLMQDYLAQAPKANINLKIANTETIRQEILDFEIDLGLLEGEIQHPDIEVYPWQRDRLCCFCSPQHSLAKCGEVDIKDLLAATWILREQGSGTRQAFDRAMQGVLPMLDIHLEFEQTEAIKRAVEKNMGISCLSEIAVAEELASGRLTKLETTFLDLERNLYLAIHRHKYRGAGIEAWLRLCGM